MALSSLSVLVDRSSLSLADLEINNGTSYIATPQISPGEVSWRREQVTSPYVDGQITVSRALDLVQGAILVRVVGTSQSNLQTLIGDLVTAFTQDQFTITISLDGIDYKWNCEAADYSMSWDKQYIHNTQAIVGFQFPRQPNPVTGPI